MKCGYEGKCSGGEEQTADDVVLKKHRRIDINGQPVLKVLTCFRSSTFFPLAHYISALHSQ